jgi:hypothetical protein
MGDNSNTFLVKSVTNYKTEFFIKVTEINTVILIINLSDPRFLNEIQNKDIFCLL